MIEAAPFYEWDDAKAQANVLKHGVDFATVEQFDWATALVGRDDRVDYGEVREIALGRIGSRLHVLVFTRRGKKLRVISLRKANKLEVTYYGNA